MASAAKFSPITLETNGKLREARRLHSITLTALCRARNWTLNGPVICSARASFTAICLTRRMVAM